MNRILDRLGRHSAAHPWRTILLWVVGVAAAFALASALGAPAQENWDAPPGAPAQQGWSCCAPTSPRPATPVPRSSSTTPTARPSTAGTLTALGDASPASPRAQRSPPRVSEDGDTALRHRSRTTYPSRTAT